MFTAKLNLEKIKILNGSWLKIIAVVSMLIDHIAQMLVKELPVLSQPIPLILGKSITIYSAMRLIGRLALPIFCFLVAEGFLYTRNKKKYGFNLLLFAIISEIPFDLLITRGKTLFNWKSQNIYFTLFLGFLLLCLLKSKMNSILKFVFSLSIIPITYFLNTDYGLNGVLLITLLYILREQKIAKTLLAFPLLSGGFAAWSSFVFINMYNGKRGFIKGNFAKYVFYAFYPIHILLLYLILKLI